MARRTVSRIIRLPSGRFIRQHTSTPTAARRRQLERNREARERLERSRLEAREAFEAQRRFAQARAKLRVRELRERRLAGRVRRFGTGASPDLEGIRRKVDARFPGLRLTEVEKQIVSGDTRSRVSERLGRPVTTSFADRIAILREAEQRAFAQKLKEQGLTQDDLQSPKIITKTVQRDTGIRQGRRGSGRTIKKQARASFVVLASGKEIPISQFRKRVGRVESFVEGQEARRAEFGAREQSRKRLTTTRQSSPRAVAVADTRFPSSVPSARSGVGSAEQRINLAQTGQRIPDAVDETTRTRRVGSDDTTRTRREGNRVREDVEGLLGRRIPTQRQPPVQDFRTRVETLTEQQEKTGRQTARDIRSTLKKLERGAEKGGQAFGALPGGGRISNLFGSVEKSLKTPASPGRSTATSIAVTGTGLRAAPATFSQDLETISLAGIGASGLAGEDVKERTRKELQRAVEGVPSELKQRAQTPEGLTSLGLAGTTSFVTGRSIGQAAFSRSQGAGGTLVFRRGEVDTDVDVRGLRDIEVLGVGDGSLVRVKGGGVSVKPSVVKARSVVVKEPRLIPRVLGTQPKKVGGAIVEGGSLSKRLGDETVVSRTIVKGEKGKTTSTTSIAKERDVVSPIVEVAKARGGRLRVGSVDRLRGEKGRLRGSRDSLVIGKERLEVFTTSRDRPSGFRSAGVFGEEKGQGVNVQGVRRFRGVGAVESDIGTLRTRSKVKIVDVEDAAGEGGIVVGGVGGRKSVQTGSELLSASAPLIRSAERGAVASVPSVRSGLASPLAVSGGGVGVSAGASKQAGVFEGGIPSFRDVSSQQFVGGQQQVQSVGRVTGGGESLRVQPTQTQLGSLVGTREGLAKPTGVLGGGFERRSPPTLAQRGRSFTLPQQKTKSFLGVGQGVGTTVGVGEKQTGGQITPDKPVPPAQKEKELSFFGAPPPPPPTTFAPPPRTPPTFPSSPPRRVPPFFPVGTGLGLPPSRQFGLQKKKKRKLRSTPSLVGIRLFEETGLLEKRKKGLFSGVGVRTVERNPFKKSKGVF